MKLVDYFLLPILVLVFLLNVLRVAFAQPPLWSEEAEILPQGISELRLGGDYAIVNSKVNQFRLPAIYWKIGLGGIAESIVLFNLGESIEDGKEMGYDVETLILATKIQVHNGEGSLPQIALGFGVKLPSQDTRKGLGPDTTDFYGRGMLTGKFGKTRLTANIGLGILEKTSQSIGQDDIFQYGISAETALNEKSNFLIEFNGHTNSSRQPTQNFILLGLRSKQGDKGFWDMAGIWGLNPSAEDFRITIGYTIVFKLF